MAGHLSELTARAFRVQSVRQVYVSPHHNITSTLTGPFNIDAMRLNLISFFVVLLPGSWRVASIQSIYCYFFTS